ncbi:MAG: MarR family transcriptional regulator, partial [Zoogloea sp.]|nr:MarR family transcriptional regulator [Zoogloea sp.]
MIDLKRQARLREAIELFFHAYRAFTAPPDRILEARG